VTDDPTGELLRFDPVAAAERVTGKQVREDPATALLGMSLDLARIDAKQKALAAARDTWMGMPFDDHLAVFAGLGFDILLDEPFENRDGVAERFVVLWRSDGLLGSCESYARYAGTNSSHLHYCWRPHCAARTGAGCTCESL